MDKISACLIVRDEERLLGRCLDSISEVVDEICVVDTGSIDGTIEVAAKYNAKIRTYLSCNDSEGRIEDFASARNAALDLATGDWILQIDGDEVLNYGASRIRRLASIKEFGQIGVQVESDGAAWVSSRLFRREPNLIYRSRVHEYVDHPGSMFVDRDIVIRNLPMEGRALMSCERNIRLCRRVLEEDPKNSRILHYLGNELRKKRDFRGAITAYSDAVKFGRFSVGEYFSYYYLGVSLLVEGRLYEAIDAALCCLKIDPRYAEAPCLLGDIYSLLGDMAFAEVWYRSARLREPPSDAVMAIQKWAYRDHPEERLSKILGERGSYD